MWVIVVGLGFFYYLLIDKSFFVYELLCVFWNLIRIWFTSQKSSGFISVTVKIFSLYMYVYSFQIRWSGLIKIKSDLSIEACCLIVFFPPVLFSLSPLFDILSLFMLLSHALCRLLFTWIGHIFVEYSISIFFHIFCGSKQNLFPSLL